MSEEVWRTVLESTHQVVRAYARAEFDALTRRVIYRLQRFGASGIFGDDYAYKSLWDEYCHEVQQGPHDLLHWGARACYVIATIPVISGASP